MSELGDERIQLLKLDIEGSEHEVLDTLELSALGVRVLCVEFHHNDPARRVRRVLRGLAEQGFDVVRRGGRAESTLLRPAA